MTTNTKYQGFSNRETWSVALWLDNDQELYNHWRRIAGESESLSDLAYKLEQWLDSEFDDASCELSHMMMKDMLNTAFTRIDFRELAEHIDGDERRFNHVKAAAEP